MHKRLVIGIAALGAAGAVAGSAIAFAGSGDSEGTLNGPQAKQAVKAALEATGGGTANAVERDNEAGATWEVEVTKPDGTTVDVRLDADFSLVQIDGDNEAADEGDAAQ
jgi:pyrroline-5-carboxylate reductase